MREQEMVTSTIDEGESKLRSALYEAEKRLKEGREQVIKLASDIDKKTHENPWPVVAGVGVSCLFLGLLIGKSKD